MKDRQNQCPGYCGMNYCDEHGCLEGKTLIGEPAPLPQDPTTLPTSAAREIKVIKNEMLPEGVIMVSSDMFEHFKKLQKG